MSVGRDALDGRPSDVPGAPRLLPILLGWVMTPLAIATTVLLLGVHLGASHPDAWYTSVVRWLGHFFR